MWMASMHSTGPRDWTFDELSTGEHRIRVALASSDNQQMGKVKLKLRISVNESSFWTRSSLAIAHQTAVNARPRDFLAKR